MLDVAALELLEFLQVSDLSPVDIVNRFPFTNHFERPVFISLVDDSRHLSQNVVCGARFGEGGVLNGCDNGIAFQSGDRAACGDGGFAQLLRMKRLEGDGEHRGSRSCRGSGGIEEEGLIAQRIDAKQFHSSAGGKFKTAVFTAEGGCQRDRILRLEADDVGESNRVAFRINNFSFCLSQRGQTDDDEQKENKERKITFHCSLCFLRLALLFSGFAIGVFHF